jgi:hypothetical protein
MHHTSIEEDDHGDAMASVGARLWQQRKHLQSQPEVPIF